MSDEFNYPVVPVEDLMRGYEKAQKFNDVFYAAVGLNAWDVSLPAAWRSPALPYVKAKDQSGVGSCVGFSMSYLADMQYAIVTGDTPSDADKATSQGTRYATDSRGQQFAYDTWYPTSFSPWSIWAYSHTPVPCGDCGGCGCEMNNAFESLVSRGVTRASTWLSPRDNCQACLDPYPNQDEVNGESAVTQALKYRANSYVVAETLEEQKLAMYLHGGAVAAISVRNNPNISDGIWRCDGAERGGHAIALVGWDEANTLLNLNSWGPGFAQIGGITKAFQDCGGLYGVWDATPKSTMPRLPGRPSVGMNVNVPLIAMAGLGTVIGGYAVYKLLTREGGIRIGGGSGYAGGY